MTKISGYLKDGRGRPIANCVIELKAKKNTSSVIVETSSFDSPNGEGYYEMEVEPCQYAVTLLIRGFPAKHVGEITVYSDSPDGTLNDFLLVPNSNEIKPELITALEQVRYENRQIVEKAKQDVQQLAQQTQNIATQTEQNILSIAEQTTGEINKSVQSALDAKNEAQNSLSNVVKKSGESIQNIDGTLNADLVQEEGVRVYSPNNKPTAEEIKAFPITGGVLNGDAIIKKNWPMLRMIGQPDNYEFRITAGNGNYTQIAATTSDNTLKTVLRWDKGIDTWNFENSNVTINNSTVLKQGDYGIGYSILLRDGSVDNSNQGSGFLFTQAKTSGVTPFPYAHIFHSRVADSFAQISVDILSKRLKFRGVVFDEKNIHYTKDKEWSEVITTENIKEYIASNNLSGYLPTSGGTITGNLNVQGLLQENGQRVYSPSNKPIASTTVAGMTQLSSAINSTAENQAATAGAVKKAYDQGVTANANANGRLSANGGMINGNLNVTGTLQKNSSNVITEATIKNHLPKQVIQSGTGKTGTRVVFSSPYPAGVIPIVVITGTSSTAGNFFVDGASITNTGFDGKYNSGGNTPAGFNYNWIAIA